MAQAQRSVAQHCAGWFGIDIHTQRMIAMISESNELAFKVRMLQLGSVKWY
jgi:hypothetical protein